MYCIMFVYNPEITIGTIISSRLEIKIHLVYAYHNLFIRYQTFICTLLTTNMEYAIERHSIQ